MPVFLLKAAAWIGNSWFGKLLLEFVLEKLTNAVNKLLKKNKDVAQAKVDAEKSTQPLKDAKTDEEIKKAAKDALSGF